jgi:hypothetical protein
LCGIACLCHNTPICSDGSCAAPPRTALALLALLSPALGERMLLRGPPPLAWAFPLLRFAFAGGRGGQAPDESRGRDRCRKVCVDLTVAMRRGTSASLKPSRMRGQICSCRSRCDSAETKHSMWCRSCMRVARSRDAKSRTTHGSTCASKRARGSVAPMPTIGRAPAARGAELDRVHQQRENVAVPRHERHGSQLRRQRVEKHPLLVRLSHRQLVQK